MQGPFRWDDLRVLVALMRQGSLSGAARELSVNVSTVSRRLDGLEAALGARLFDRTPDGVLPTDAAEKLMPVAEEVESAAARVHSVVEGFETEPEGWVRVTAPPGVISIFLAPLVGRLIERYPKLRLQLDPGIGYADLSRREADLALRAVRPQTGDLVAVKLGSYTSEVQASSEVARAAGVVRELSALRWITWSPALAHIPDARWILDQVDERDIILRTDSPEAQIRGAESGLGAIVGPTVNRTATSLESIELAPSLRGSLMPFPEQDLWLVGHRALRNVPRIAAVWGFILDEFRGLPADSGLAPSRAP